MPIFSADTWFLSDRFIFLEEEILHFFSSLSTGTDFVINFDLVKCITKVNINSYPNYNGKVEGGLSPESKIYASARCTSMVYSTDILNVM